MPLLPATDPPRKRRTLVGVIFLAGVCLPLMGLVGWSWIRPPVRLSYGHQGVAFGHTNAGYAGCVPFPKTGYRLTTGPGYQMFLVKLPGGEKIGWYVTEWHWR